MSGILSISSAGAFDSTPDVEYLGDVFLGERAANSTFTHTLNIGDPHPNRRILVFNTNDYFSTSPSNPTLVQTCRANGVSLPRVGQLADGFVVSTDFAVYTNRTSSWTSQIIPDGTTASFEFDCSARTYWCRVGFVRVTNLLSDNPAFQTTLGSPHTISSIPAGQIIVFTGRASSNSSNDSPTSVTNTTFLFREGSGSVSTSQAPYSAFLYQNTTRQPQDVTFTPDQGGIGTVRWR